MSIHKLIGSAQIVTAHAVPLAQAPSPAPQTMVAAGWQARPLPGCEANYSALITTVVAAVLTTVCPSGSFLGRREGMTPRSSPPRSRSLKLDPNNTLVAAVQGNAWLLSHGLLASCVHPHSTSLLPLWLCRRAHQDRLGTAHLLSTDAIALLPTAEPGRWSSLAARTN